MRPSVCVLRTDGTNCDEETKFAFELAGARGCLVHVNQLLNGDKKLSDFQMLVIPGGFSYGGYTYPGKIFAIELETFLMEQFAEFADSQKPILGISDGFHVLVKMGLLSGAAHAAENTATNRRLEGDSGSTTTTHAPGATRSADAPRIALVGNAGGDFECRWVKMKVENSNCIFTRGAEGRPARMQVAHNEGKFFAEKDCTDDLVAKRRIVLRYVDDNNQPTMLRPFNPFGSVDSIAGVCDTTGRILGLMPFPERFVTREQYPNWRAENLGEPHGLFIFQNAVEYARGL